MSEPPYRTSASPPRCPCGYDASHYMVSAIGNHSVLGWLLIMFGIGVPATRMIFRCRVCDQVIDVTTDPEVMEQNHLRG
jgi:hypothetical protein